MPRSSSTSTVTRNPSNGQYILTVPKPLAEGMGMGDKTKVKWEIKGVGKLQMEIQKE